MIKGLKTFLEKEASGGLVLIAAAALAMAMANSPALSYYETFLTPNATFFINDVLMAVFFLLVGLEIRAEIHDGTLSTLKQASLPFIAAAGGVMVPALIYISFNYGTPGAQGWAIPTATDIAFSLGVLVLVASRLPETLKIFLMAVAVIDDVIAIIIIALFYSDTLNGQALAAGAACIVILWSLTKRNAPLWSFLIVGVALWCAVHASGVHSTIAGVILGLMIPPRLGERCIETLHVPVAFMIVPLFAFANAGIALEQVTADTLLQPVALGIILGLLIGKPLGICAASYIAVRMKLSQLPHGVNWAMFFAMSVTAGIGFTMSLFIGELAFADGGQMVYVKCGVVLGSLLSALLGAGLLYRSSSNRN